MVVLISVSVESFPTYSEMPPSSSLLISFPSQWIYEGSSTESITALSYFRSGIVREVPSGIQRLHWTLIMGLAKDPMVCSPLKE